MENRTILIYLADDDEDDRMIFQQVLSGISSQARLVATEDGNKLLELLFHEESTPDLILLDLNMPNKNGKETLKLIRQHKRFDGVPVIIYSTSTSSIDIDESYKFGANMYMEKPYQVPHLAEVLTMVVGYDWKDHFPPAREKFFLGSKKK